jgi:hypothetical protein
MKGTLGTFAALVALTLAVAPLARAEEPSRESYVAQLEPICQANRAANERIMNGAKERVSAGKLKPAGRQFIRVSRSFGSLIKQIAAVPPPPADSHRVERWLALMHLLEGRLLNVGKYFIEGEKIKATHESIQAERSGNSANNAIFALHFRYCRFTRFK